MELRKDQFNALLFYAFWKLKTKWNTGETEEFKVIWGCTTVVNKEYSVCDGYVVSCFVLCLKEKKRCVFVNSHDEKNLLVTFCDGVEEWKFSIRYGYTKSCATKKHHTKMAGWSCLLFLNTNNTWLHLKGYSVHVHTSIYSVSNHHSSVHVYCIFGEFLLTLADPLRCCLHWILFFLRGIREI